MKHKYNSTEFELDTDKYQWAKLFYLDKYTSMFIYFNMQTKPFTAEQILCCFLSPASRKWENFIF